MILLRIENHKYDYELQDIVKMFFGKQEISVEHYPKALDENQSFFQTSMNNSIENNKDSSLDKYDVILTSSFVVHAGSHLFQSQYQDKHGSCTAACTVVGEGAEALLKRTVKKSMYQVLSEALEKTFPWGILTGIRPVKLVHELQNRGVSPTEIESSLMEDYLVSKDRAKLAIEIAYREKKYIEPVDPQSVSVYIGIPFCPSRCHYCSFTSNSIISCADYVEGYLDALYYEVKETALFIKRKGLRVESLYIGGGTPTAISEKLFEQLLQVVGESFGEGCKEFTCEAGRPDTITLKKLNSMKQNGVTRISINPQTMKDETLKRIGRDHTTRQTVESFMLARNSGFSNINMDIILGLPGENTESARETLDRIAKLSPESITVHTMALKRASAFNEKYSSMRPDEGDAASMMELARTYMKGLSMHPYYMYRQKHMLQNLENIGFSKDGYECVYNMQIIEEKQTNIACGADAVTKVVFNKENRIERHHNIKDLKIYIDTIHEQCKKKLKLLEEWDAAK